MPVSPVWNSLVELSFYSRRLSSKLPCPDSRRGGMLCDAVSCKQMHFLYCAMFKRTYMKAAQVGSPVQRHFCELFHMEVRTPANWEHIKHHIDSPFTAVIVLLGQTQSTERQASLPVDGLLCGRVLLLQPADLAWPSLLQSTVWFCRLPSSPGQNLITIPFTFWPHERQRCLR